MYFGDHSLRDDHSVAYHLQQILEDAVEPAASQFLTVEASQHVVFCELIYTDSLLEQKIEVPFLFGKLLVQKDEFTCTVEYHLRLLALLVQYTKVCLPNFP